MRTCRPLVLACLLLARPGVGRPMVRTAAATSGWTELQEAQGTAGDQRDITGDQRDITGDQQDITGDQRDITGDERDITGDQWDITGDQQDITEAASYIVALKPEGILEAFDVVSEATSEITRDVVVGPAVGEDPVVTESYQDGQLEDGSAVSAEAGDDPATPTYTDDEDPDTYVQIPEEEPSADGEDNAEELDPAGRISEEGLPSEHTQSEVEEAGRDLPKTTDRIGSGLDSVASAGDGEPVSSRASSEDVSKSPDGMSKTMLKDPSKAHAILGNLRHVGADADGLSSVRSVEPRAADGVFDSSFSGQRGRLRLFPSRGNMDEALLLIRDIRQMLETRMDAFNGLLDRMRKGETKLGDDVALIRNNVENPRRYQHHHHHDDDHHHHHHDDDHQHHHHHDDCLHRHQSDTTDRAGGGRDGAVSRLPYRANFRDGRPDRYHVNAHQHGGGYCSDDSEQQQTVVNVFLKEDESDTGNNRP